MAFQRIVRSMRKGNTGIGILSLILLGIGLFLLWHGKPGAAVAQGPSVAAPSSEGRSSQGMAFIAAAVSVGLSSIGAGIAVSMVGSAAMGAVAERPELMGRSIIYVGLAEGIAIYGLIIGIMILGKV